MEAVVRDLRPILGVQALRALAYGLGSVPIPIQAARLEGGPGRRSGPPRT